MATHDNFAEFWENDECADVTFFVGEDSNTWRFGAHKMLLSKKNLMFREMFHPKSDQLLKEPKTEVPKLETIPGKDDEIRITDIRPEIFDKLLRFIYTGELEIDSVNAALLLHDAGRQFNVKEVTSSAIQYLTAKVTPKNLLEIYIYTEEYLEEEETVPLHAVLAAGIDSKTDEILRTNAFTSLSPRSLDRITSRSTLHLSSELILFEALVRWSIAECKRRQLVVNNKNKRLVLGNILFNVRFGLMKKEELSEVYKVEGLLSDEDLGDKGLPRSRNPFISSCLILPLAPDNFDKYHDFSESFRCKRKMMLKAVAILRNILHPFNDVITITILKNNEQILHVDKKEFHANSYPMKGKLTLELTKPAWIEADDIISVIIRRVPNKFIKKCFFNYKWLKYFKKEHYTIIKWRKSSLCLYSLTELLGWDQIVELQFSPSLKDSEQVDASTDTGDVLEESTRCRSSV